MRKRLFVCMLCTTIATAQAATVAPLVAHDLVGIAGKEGTMISVELAPDEASPVHRHDANVFVYMLSGTVVMQVRGQAEVTLRPGQTFYEAPADVHVVTRNASHTEPAKFIAFLVKAKGAPIGVPAR